jgi:hypothetical protein
MRSFVQAQETFPMALEAEHVRHQLDRLRRDARKQAAAAINRVIWQARTDKALGSDRIYGTFERAVDDAFRGALIAAARILLDLPSGVLLDRVSALERMATDLAADILVDREDRRGSVGRVRLDGPNFDNHVRRTRAAMDDAREKIVAELRLGLVEGQAVSSPSGAAESLQALLDQTVAISRSPSASAIYSTVADQLTQLLQSEGFRALAVHEQADIAIEVQEITAELERTTPEDGTVPRKLRGLARMLRGVGIGAHGSTVGQLVNDWLTT